VVILRGLRIHLHGRLRLTPFITQQQKKKSTSASEFTANPDWISRPDDINPPDRPMSRLGIFLTFLSVLPVFISSLDLPCCLRHRWFDTRSTDSYSTYNQQPKVNPDNFIQAAISHTSTSILPTLPNKLLIRRPLNNSQPVSYSPEHKSHSHPSSTDLIQFLVIASSQSTIPLLSWSSFSSAVYIDRPLILPVCILYIYACRHF